MNLSITILLLVCLVGCVEAGRASAFRECRKQERNCQESCGTADCAILCYIRLIGCLAININVATPHISSHKRNYSKNESGHNDTAIGLPGWLREGGASERLPGV
ncbi:hypothetical protein ScPMuIL_011778 [Solemya velum]